MLIGTGSQVDIAGSGHSHAPSIQSIAGRVRDPKTRGSRSRIQSVSSNQVAQAGPVNRST